jgi:hypothetical protein
MRPKRASPNGTSERSSTRPPKYRALSTLAALNDVVHIERDTNADVAYLFRLPR